MNDTTKIIRIASGVAAIIAGVLMIVVANMLIADFMPVFGNATRTNALVVLSYIMIGVAVLSKLASVVLIAKQKTMMSAAALIITQIVLMALEITTVVLWVGMNNNMMRVIDYIFMAVSLLSIILAVVFLVRQSREPENQSYTYKNA